MRALSFCLCIGLVPVGSLRSQSNRIDPATRVAQVNGTAITLGEVDAALRQRPAPLAAPTAVQVRQLRLDVITTMIDDLLLRQFMSEHGPKIDSTVIDKQLSALVDGLKAQNRTLADYVRELNLTEKQLRDNMLLLLQLDAYVKEQTTEADMRSYFEANRDYFNRTTVRVSHIVVRLSPDASPVERDRVRQKLLAVRAEIVAGTSEFAAKAKEVSQCPSAARGGDIGSIHRKFQNVDEAFAKAAFAMKIGELSQPVDSDFGVHLLKVTERQEGKQAKFEAALEDVRDCYAEDLRTALLNQLRKKAKVEITLP